VTNVSEDARLQEVTAREILHTLVDDLPEEKLRQARLALERVCRRAEDKAARDRHEIEIINAHSDELAQEMEDVLSYQADW
jgi:hypothetical protein